MLPVTLSRWHDLKFLSSAANTNGAFLGWELTCSEMEVVQDFWAKTQLKRPCVLFSILHAVVAAFCVVLASKSVDKCHPVPLANNEYSTRTAHLLKEAFGPLHYVLGCLHPHPNSNNKGKSTVRTADTLPPFFFLPHTS